MLRALLLIMIATTLTGCGQLFRTSSSRGGPQVSVSPVQRTILVYSEKLKYEQDIHLEDSNIYFNRQINRIRLDYTTMKIYDMCEARALLVDLVEGLLGQLREQGYALSPYNLEIFITFPSFYSTKIDLQTVGLISLRKGVAHYIAADAFYCEDDCWHKRDELYQQSKDFVGYMREGQALYKAEEEKKPSVLEEERYIPIDFETR